jgi:hypothetical protein
MAKFNDLIEDIKSLLNEINIKKQTELPPGTRITKVDPGVANAVPLRKLYARADKAGTLKVLGPGGSNPAADAEREREAEREMEIRRGIEYDPEGPEAARAKAGGYYGDDD